MENAVLDEANPTGERKQRGRPGRPLFRPSAPRRWLDRQSGAARALIAGALALLLGVASFLVVAPGVAQAATTQTCSFADPGSGTYAKTLCVLDLSVVDPVQAATAAGQDIRLEVGGGNYTIDYNFHTTGRAANPTVLPTYSGAFFGNRGFYTGIAGKPAWYQVDRTADSERDTSMTIRNVVVRDRSGAQVSSYALVGIDAEATDTGESLGWSFDQPARLVGPIGNACDSGFSGEGTTDVVCSSAAAKARTGTAMVAADRATTMTMSLKGPSRQAGALAVLMSFAQLSKVVDSRIDSTDAFDVSVTAPSGTVLGSGNTGAGSSATTGVLAIASAPTDAFTLAETTNATTVDGYRPDWSCVRNGAPDPTLPSGDAGMSAAVLLDVGDYVDCTITNTARTTGLVLQKHAGTPDDVNQNGIVDAGDTIPFSFTLTNTGELSLDRLQVSDPLVGAVTCPSAPLAPGDSVTCTAASVYVITTADATAGAVNNTASASGRPVGSTELVVHSGTSSTSTPISTAAPGIALVKSATPTAVHNAGDTIDYRFTVTNTGNVPVDGVSIDETAFTGSGPVPAAACPSIGIAPGNSLVCVATYQATQADVDAGGVQNTAVARAAAGPVAVESPSSQADVTIAPSLGIQLVKSSDQTGGSLTAGQTITYTFVVTNTGNVTLSDVTVDEAGFTGSGTPGPIVCEPGAGTMAPGDTVTCTMQYTATQTDIDNGGIQNSATASGNPPSGARLTSAPSSTESTATRTPSLSIEKTVTPGTATIAGADVTYDFVVTNTGNVRVTDVGVTEGAFSGTGTAPTVACPAGTDALLPGERLTCTAAYTVTQADIDAGQVSNTATATGTDPDGAAVTSPPSTAVLEADPLVALALLKTADPLTADHAGQTIAYTFVVTNVGTVSVSDVGIDEGAFSGTGAPVVVTCAGVTTIAPGQQTTCTGSYTLTQEDVDAGGVDNTAAAVGASVGGQPVVSPDSTVRVPVAAVSSMTIVKSAVPGTPTVGSTVAYRFDVTNTGNTTLNDVAVAEDSFSGTGPSPAVDCPTQTLAPGAAVICTADYVVTQQDADAGKLDNQASASAQPPGDGPRVVAPPSATVVDIPAVPTLAFSKTVDPEAVTVQGETVTYTYTLTNTGNVTMHGVTVAEGAFTGTGAMPVPVCPPDAIIAPGESVDCSATYTVTADDADTGWVTNTATGSAVPPAGGAPVESEPSSATLTIPPGPGISLTKTASPTTISAIGDVITYTFVVTNTGNVTLTDVTVDETDFSGTGTTPNIHCPDLSSLAAGASATCTADYAVTAADVDAGEVNNTATASGFPPGDGSPITSEASSGDVLIPATPALGLTKTASPDTVRRVGDVVTYSFVVVNDGTVTVHDLAVDEGTFSGTGALTEIDCPVTELGSGEKTTCTAEYTVTAADAVAGSLTNTATATGRSPSGDEVRSPESTATVTIDVPAEAGEETPGTGLAGTGSNLAVGAIMLVVGMLLLGVILILVQRRRRSHS